VETRKTTIASATMIHDTVIAMMAAASAAALISGIRLGAGMWISSPAGGAVFCGSIALMSRTSPRRRT
jgi:hypothetical protein